MSDIHDNSDTGSTCSLEIIFTEPPDFRPATPPPPTFSTHTLLSGEKLTLRLVGHDPLWGHHLWNSGRVIARYLESHKEELVRDREVLELGAGAGLPGLVCAAVGGAKRVVITDYPSPNLISNIQHNIDTCDLIDHTTVDVSAQGYLWGADPTPLLLKAIPPTSPETNRFDLLLLSDLLFNHSCHASLLSTIKLTLAKPSADIPPTALIPLALVFFTPHRPWLYDKDIAFLTLAREQGFRVEQVVQEVLEKPMFDEDKGDVELRRTVFGYTLTWAEGGEEERRRRIEREGREGGEGGRLGA